MSGAVVLGAVVRGGSERILGWVVSIGGLS